METSDTYSITPQISVPDEKRPHILVDVTPHEPVLIEEKVKQSRVTTVLGRFNSLDDTEILEEDERIYDRTIQQVYIAVPPMPVETRTFS
jgi:PHD/YefM family antitoxin component YafN of YafNO toxin-antitoxin module